LTLECTGKGLAGPTGATSTAVSIARRVRAAPGVLERATEQADPRLTVRWPRFDLAIEVTRSPAFHSAKSASSFGVTSFCHARRTDLGVDIREVDPVSVLRLLHGLVVEPLCLEGLALLLEEPQHPIHKVAGRLPHLWVTGIAFRDRWLSIDVRNAPFATEITRWCKITRWAIISRYA
jgi:hypothetical protein